MYNIPSFDYFTLMKMQYSELLFYKHKIEEKFKAKEDTYKKQVGEMKNRLKKKR
jgi:hypothetical protein